MWANPCQFLPPFQGFGLCYGRSQCCLIMCLDSKTGNPHKQPMEGTIQIFSCVENWNRTIIIETYEIWNIPRKKKCETTNQYLASKEIYMQNGYYVQSSNSTHKDTYTTWKANGFPLPCLGFFHGPLQIATFFWEWNSPISSSRPQLG